MVAEEVLRGECNRLGAETTRHLHALRLSPGSHITLTDGLGEQRLAVLESVGRATAVIRLCPAALTNTESALELTLCLGLHKWDRMEWAIEKLTELGVRTIHLVRCERSPPSWTSARMQRLRRIAAAATEQAQRAIVPLIHDPEPLTKLLESTGPHPLRLLAYEDAPQPSGPTPLPARASHVTIMIGPAGGFTPAEAISTTEHGWRLLRVGPRILRAETAAVAAAALAQARWGDLRV